MRPGTLLTAFGCVIALAAGAAPARAQSVQLAQFPAGQAFSSPYYVTGAPGDTSRVFVTEAAGTIRLVKDGVLQPTPFLDITGDVLSGGERGLFSMAFAPDYATSGLFYVFYTRDDPTQEHYLRIEEFRRSASNPDVADPATRRIVMEIPHLTAGNHNGGQLQFGPDGYLYISVGDGGDTPNNGQLLTTRLGKILRIDPRGSAPFQYSIPPDNPFADGAGPNADEIYAYGLRNPYRFSFDRATGDLVIGDVGDSSWEEVDYEPEGGARGANFGWPCYEATHVHTTTGVCSPLPANHSPPVAEYANPAAGSSAVNGGYVVRDPSLPGLLGRYLYTDTYGAISPANQIRSTLLGPGGATGDTDIGVGTGFVVSFGQDACGHIYVASRNVVDRIEPVSGELQCKAAPIVSASTVGVKKILKRKAVPVLVACDEDCTATATGSIVISKRGRGKPKRLKTLVARPSTARVQMDALTEVLLGLSRKQRRALAKASSAGRQFFVTVEVSATGGGGGTAVARAANRPGIR
jgi:glucose/arabinose dehydrogenase